MYKHKITCLLLALSTVCLIVYLIDLVNVRKSNQSNAFDRIAGKIRLSLVQLDLNQQTAVLLVQFSSTNSDNIEISTKSTRDIERIFRPSLIIDNKNYPVKISNDIVIPANSTSIQFPCKIMNPDNVTYMKSSEMTQLISKKKSNKLIFAYTIQSCRSKGRVYDSKSKFDYTKNVKITLD